MDKFTTNKLDKLCKIEGYQITRIKNILMMKRSIKQNEQLVNHDIEITTITR